jgi:hypothetical protein
VVADPLTEAIDCAQRIAGLPRQAVESAKRLLNLQLDRAVLATLDFAMTAEEQSFQTDDSARRSPDSPRASRGKSAPTLWLGWLVCPLTTARLAGSRAMSSIGSWRS